MSVPLDEFSKIISEKLGEKINLAKAEKVSGGYEADAFVVHDENGRKFFIKKFKKEGQNKAHLEKDIHWFLTSDSMMKRSQNSPDGLGVVVGNNGKYSVMPTLNSDSEVFHIQNFEELESENYWKIISAKKEKNKLDEEDLEDVRKIAELLSQIHSSSLGDISEEEKKGIYNDSLSSVFTAQDLYFFFLHSFEEDHDFFPPEKHGSYTGEMLKLFHNFKNKGHRLRPLHGDFWGNNLHKRKDGSWHAVDYSRIPVGDPGIDVAAWIAQYLWLYHETGNKIYRELGEEFLNHYEKISGDQEIREHLNLPMGLWGLIWITPYFYPERTHSRAKKFFETVWNNLKNKKIGWE